jgi:hypothetical protein
MKKLIAIILAATAVGLSPLAAQNENPATLLNQEVILEQGVEVAEPETPYKR